MEVDNHSSLLTSPPDGVVLRMVIGVLAHEDVRQHDAAQTILMGQADEATPVVIAGGLDWRDSDAGAAALRRPEDEDLFR